MRTLVNATFSALTIFSAASVVSATSESLNYELKSIFIGSHGDPGDSVEVTSINDGGEFVGFSTALGAFAEKRDDLTFIKLPKCPACGGGPTGFPFKINSRGDILGTVQLTPSLFTSFVYSGSHTRLITGPAGINGFSATSLNNHGEVVGFYSDPDGKYHLFLDRNGRFTSFSLPFPGVTVQVANDINDAGQIIGTYIDTSGPHGFIYSNGIFTKVEFPFGSDSNASLDKINARGQIIGKYYDTQGASHSFLYVGGHFSTLTADDFGEMFFTAINDRGDVAGTPWAHRQRIILHTADGEFSTADIQGASRVSISVNVSALNNNGQIVGTYKFNGGRECDDSCPEVGFLVNPVTPATP